MHDPAGKALSALSELVFVCKVLPHFDTIKILCFPADQPYNTPSCRQEKCSCSVLCKVQWERLMKEQAKGMKNFVIDHLKKSKAGRQEGDERKRIMVRVVRTNISLSQIYSPLSYPPGSVEVEECEI